MIKIVFLVLQYNVPEETIECVESILKNMKKDYKIVVIDNCSERENYLSIKRKYSVFKQIDIIRTKKNLGFSGGNNYGFLYSKEKYDPKFYYFISNDTLLTNKNIMKTIEQEYAFSKFDVLGADIVELDGKHVSPIKGNLNSSRVKTISRYLLLFIAQYLNIYILLYKIKHLFTKKSFSKIDHTHRKEDVAFQGSALLFSKKCFRELPRPFYPETFFYSEEDILNYNRIKYGLKFIYNPNIQIIHKESGTVNKLIKTKKSIVLFKLKQNIKSLNIFYDYVEQDKKQAKYEKRDKKQD